MKKLLGIVVLGLFLIAPSQANDIRDYQLYNISIGDSALKFFNKKKIEKNKMMHWYKNKKVTPVLIKVNEKDYDDVSFTYWTNDENYTIIEITGMKDYINNIEQCYKEKKDQVKIIKESFTSLKETSEKGKHPADKSGKSKFDSTEFNFKSGGYIRLACYDWSKKMGYEDHFRIGILSKEFDEWLAIAYE